MKKTQIQQMIKCRSYVMHDDVSMLHDIKITYDQDHILTRFNVTILERDSKKTDNANIILDE